MTLRHRRTILLVLALPAVVGCRGEISRKPPVHLVKDMDFQAKFKAQSEASFGGWSDGRAMREPVPGTVARGHLGALSPDQDVAKLHTYKRGDTYVTQNPLPLTAETLDRGQEKYDINCAICHGRTGRGNGPVGLRWPTKPSSFLTVAGPVPFPSRKADEQKPDRMDDGRVPKLVDGEIFDVIANGRSTMPAYGHQIPVEDRWAIIHYIRALQLRVTKRR